MTKLCQQYLSDIKSLFPIMGKPEKKYLTKLSHSIDDFCLEENVTTLDDIYKDFGHPGEIVNTYLTSVDTSDIIKRIRYAKWLKRGIIAVLIISLIGVSIYGITTYKAYKILEQEQIYFDETEINN